MARKTKWERAGQVVTTSDIRLWMATVGRHISPRGIPLYVKNFDVVGKIAHHKAAGTFDATIQQHIEDYRLKVRKARKPGTLARLRSTWPASANDSQTLQHLSHVRDQC